MGVEVGGAHVTELSGSAPSGPMSLADGARGLMRGLLAAAEWLPKGNSLPLSEWETRHSRLLVLLWAHVAGLPLFAVARGYSPAHAFSEGLIVAAVAVPATLPGLAPRWRGAIAATGLMTCSALLVHFSNGNIEAHFHFFVVILLLALYEDWLPFLIALAYVVVHHGVVGTLSPRSVYNHQSAIEHPWLWAGIHGAFIAAAAVSAIVAWRFNEVSRAHAAAATAHAVRSEEANELKSTFIAMTSHELRTPLTSIVGFATTLTHRWDTVDDDDRRKLVGIIESQSVRLQDLIENLLLLSAAESGKLRVRAATMDVRAVAEQAVSVLPDRTGIVVDVADGLHAKLDAQHLTQILVNYLTNAQKYGRPPVVLQARARNGWIDLVVADSGDGVPPAFVPRLFEPFDRAEDQTSGTGTGLGLSIVRGLSDALGGEAWYEPNAPSGSRFRVRFPLEPSPR